MTDHVERSFQLPPSETLLNDIARARAILHEITGENFEDGEILLTLIDRGLRHLDQALLAPHSAKRVGDMSALELADIFGVKDIRALRRNAIEGRRRQGEILSEALATFKDAKGLRMLGGMNRFSTCAEWEAFSKSVMGSLAQAQNVAIVACIGWVDVTEEPTPNDEPTKMTPDDPNGPPKVDGPKVH